MRNPALAVMLAVASLQAASTRWSTAPVSSHSAGALPANLGPAPRRSLAALRLRGGGKHGAVAFQVCSGALASPAAAGPVMYSQSARVQRLRWHVVLRAHRALSRTRLQWNVQGCDRLVKVEIVGTWDDWQTRSELGFM
jgi:hypothetical protein